jgi:hypothetical protein
MAYINGLLPGDDVQRNRVLSRGAWRSTAVHDVSAVTLNGVGV